MLKYCLSVALFCSAGAALAQSQAATSPAPAPAMTPQQSAIQSTATALGQCVQAGVQSLAATVTPEAGAASVLAGCGTQRQALDRAVEALIATLPEASKAGAREQYRTQMAAAQAQVVAGISQMRAAPAAPPAQ